MPPPQQHLAGILCIQVGCDATAEAIALVVTPTPLFPGMQRNGQYPVDLLQGLFRMQNPPIPVSEPVPDTFLPPILEVMDQALHGSSRFEIEQGSGPDHGTLPVKKAVGRAVCLKMGIGQGQFISTKCAQDVLSPI